VSTDDSLPGTSNREIRGATLQNKRYSKSNFILKFQILVTLQQLLYKETKIQN
jgi:hypothetical protein